MNQPRYHGYLTAPPWAEARDVRDAADYGRLQLTVAILAGIIIIGFCIDLYRRKR